MSAAVPPQIELEEAYARCAELEARLREVRDESAARLTEAMTQLQRAEKAEAERDEALGNWRTTADILQAVTESAENAEARVAELEEAAEALLARPLLHQARDSVEVKNLRAALETRRL